MTDVEHAPFVHSLSIPDVGGLSLTGADSVRLDGGVLSHVSSAQRWWQDSPKGVFHPVIDRRTEKALSTLNRTFDVSPSATVTFTTEGMTFAGLVSEPLPGAPTKERTTLKQSVWSTLRNPLTDRRSDFVADYIDDRIIDGIANKMNSAKHKRVANNARAGVLWFGELDFANVFRFSVAAQSDQQRIGFQTASKSQTDRFFSLILGFQGRDDIDWLEVADRLFRSIAERKAAVFAPGTAGAEQASAALAQGIDPEVRERIRNRSPSVDQIQVGKFIALE